MSKKSIPEKNMPVEVKVKNIIIDKTGMDTSVIADTALFTDDLGIDSLDLFEIFMEAEKQFDIKIADEDAEKMRTVGSLITFIKNKN